MASVVSRDAPDPFARCDFVRRSPLPIGGAGQHKEWQHFAILTENVDLLVNFSLSDSHLPGAHPSDEIPRVVVLLRAAEWDGDVESYDTAATSVASADIDLEFDGNRLQYIDGRFRIWVALRARPIRIDLELKPLTEPAFVPNVPMLDGAPLHWVVAPRLRVAGTITLGARTIDLTGALAYHDHNWGHFAWGHDVSWEWGFVLPDDPRVPWSVTFVRLTNRARTIALAQKILVWHGTRLHTVFREDAVHFDVSQRFLRPREVFKVPRAMALVAPETCCDVPSSLHVFAGVEASPGSERSDATHRDRSGSDRIDIDCRMLHVGQVLIPSETELGVTIFNEVTARTRVRGQISGAYFDYSGRSILEFIRD